MKKFILSIICLLVCSTFLAAEVIPMPGLGKPDSITIYKGRLYITDRGTISIYSMKDFKLIKTFGKAGEGPGEFKVSAINKIGLRITVKDDYILVNSMSKVSLFTLDGTFKQEKRILLNPSTQQFKPFGNKYVGFHRATENDINLFFVHFYDPGTLQKEKEIHRMSTWVSGNKLDTMRIAMLFKKAVRRGPMFHVYKDRLFIEGEDCRIFVYDRQGKQLYSINVHDYEKLTIPESFKKEAMKYLEKRLPTAFINVKRNGQFPQYFPLRSLQVDDGKVYVQTFKSEAGKSEFYIFDANGKLVSKAMVPFVEAEFLLGYPFTISKGKFYQLIENDDAEEWVLHITEINAPGRK
jgi:hypothetical protein